MRHTSHGSERPRRIARSAVIVAACLLLAAACDLGVSEPDVITPTNLTGASALPTIRDAALGDFALAYSGSGAEGTGGGEEGIILASGLLADEFVNSETFPTRIEIDRRATQVTNSTLTNWFREFMRARRSVEFAAASYRQYSPDTTKETGFPEMIALSGYMYLFFAENFCSGVPMSNALPDGSLQFGQPLTTANLIDSAVARFKASLAAANALTGVAPASKAADVNLASVGLGRAFLDRGSWSNAPAWFDSAAAAVGGVPTSFVYLVYHSQNTTRQNNGVYVAMALAKRYSVSDGEGTNGLLFRTNADARVPSVRTGNGFDGTTPQWNQMRFVDRPNPDPLSTGAEARLIEAEDFLAKGDTVNFLARHNGLRAAPPAYFAPPAPAAPIAPLAALTTTGLTSQQVQLLHFQEREYWLWNSGHRLGDLRRLTHAPYGFGSEQVFPTGAYFKGGLYGTDTNFPVPFDETNNPNFTQCLDRNP